MLAATGQLGHAREIEHAFDQMPDASDEQQPAADAAAINNHEHERDACMEGPSFQFPTAPKPSRIDPRSSPDAVRLGHGRLCYYPGNPQLIHIQHFLDCVATGKTPISNVSSQHRSVSACHLANIAMRLGRSIRWDPEAEMIVDDSQAAAMISRQSRPI